MGGPFLACAVIGSDCRWSYPFASSWLSGSTVCTDTWNVMGDLWMAR